VRAGSLTTCWDCRVGEAVETVGCGEQQVPQAVAGGEHLVEARAHRLQRVQHPVHGERRERGVEAGDDHASDIGPRPLHRGPVRVVPAPVGVTTPVSMTVAHGGPPPLRQTHISSPSHPPAPIRCCLNGS